MLLVGLTGGIGSGKSTVAAMLGRRGAVVLDADEFARRAVDPGTPGFREVVEAFGDDVLTAEGGLDRSKLAAVVFADPDRRARLEAIVHPEVGRLFREAIEPYRDTDRIVVYAVPLLVETHLESMFDVLVVVSAPEEVRVGRLVARGLTDDDARSRIRAQISEDERNAVADVVIPNDGSESDLEHRVDDLWRELRTTAAGDGSAEVAVRAGDSATPRDKPSGTPMESAGEESSGPSV
jgi:dephospho-CoA kinase